MAREEKRFELKPVDDEVEAKAPVIRLESEETLLREKPIRLGPNPEEVQVSRRLDLPAREDFESRTHQPGIEALIESELANPDFMEQDWGKENTRHASIPWGWFVLIGLILAGAVIWSLAGAKKEVAVTDGKREPAETVLGGEVKEELEAARLVDRIEAAARRFVGTASVDSLARLVRHPERVRPLMDAYYGGKPAPTDRLLRTRLLQPLTLDQRANFWMMSVEVANHESRNLILEIPPSGEPLIDWETFVCYQPMAWDRFATERPTGTSLDFRVYLEADNFFSHEFADSKRWNCFRLTALDSEETLFGYANAGGETSAALVKLLEEHQGRRTSVILRLSIPEGIQSRRGVVIEKLLSPRWIYLNPPEA